MNSKVTSVLIMAFGCFLTSRAADGDAERKQSDFRDAFFSNNTIPHLRIQLDAAAIAALQIRMREYVKATVHEGTSTYRDVGIHLKGQYGTFQGLDGKPSLTLNFDKYLKNQRFHGLDKLHLNNSAQDPSYLCELIGRQLFREAGVPTGRATHARVHLNGRDLGLFVLIEGYDRAFLKRHFADPDGNLYDSEFRHDVTDPIKRSAGKGPTDHSDLLSLVAMSEEPNHTQRLTRFSKVLDLDRYYSMLALETLVRHHDGYSMGINNYRVYHDPATGRATFLPGGMDQLFFEPHASVLPDLKGVMSKAILETQEGRSEFRKRCAIFYTNLFPDLSNRIEMARTRIRPTLAYLDPKVVRRVDDAATNLLHRVRQRLQHLARELPATAYPPNFNSTAIATMTNWVATMEGGKAEMYVTNGVNGKTLLTRLGADGEHTIARWQSLVLLPPGTYRFSAGVTADQPVFRGPVPPVALRVWAVSDVQLETRRPSRESMELQCVFNVHAGDHGEYALQCEAKGLDVPVTYCFDSVIIARLQ